MSTPPEYDIYSLAQERLRGTSHGADRSSAAMAVASVGRFFSGLAWNEASAAAAIAGSSLGDGIPKCSMFICDKRVWSVGT